MGPYTNCFWNLELGDHILASEILNYGPTLLLEPWIMFQHSCFLWLTFAVLILYGVETHSRYEDWPYRKTIKFKFFTLLYIPTFIPDGFEWNCLEEAGGWRRGGGGGEGWDGGLCWIIDVAASWDVYKRAWVPGHPPRSVLSRRFVIHYKNSTSAAPSYCWEFCWHTK